MPDIEFLPESADADDADEVLSGGSRRRTLRWLGGAGFAAVVLAAVVVAATRGGDTPSVAPPAPASGTSSSAAVADPNSGLKPVFLGEFSGQPVLAITVLGRSIWVLQSDGLHVVRPAGRRDRLQLPVGLQDVRLVPDPQARLVWLVAKGLAQAYDTRVNAVIGAHVPAFTDVAPMDGRLYVVSGNDLLEIGAHHPTPRRILSGLGRLGALAADPARHRLIVASLGDPTHLWAVTPRGYGLARIDRTARVRVTKVSVRVARGAIWVAGFDTGDGVLMRLDPRTLRPVLRSPLAPQLEPGAIVVGTGTDSLWVREGDGGSVLRCVDAASGRQLQSWTLGGQVASVKGRGVIGTSFGPAYLDLRSCPG